MLYRIIVFLSMFLCLRYAIAFLSNGFVILFDNSNADLNSVGNNNCDVDSSSSSIMFPISSNSSLIVALKLPLFF